MLRYCYVPNTFVHIPRTAGSFISRRLPTFNYKGCRLRDPDHVKLIKRTNWKEQHDYSFSVVRHPLERALSTWFFFERAKEEVDSGINHMQFDTFMVDRNERDWVLSNCKDLEEFSAKLGFLCIEPSLSYHILPQHWWVYDHQNQLKVHEIFKMENMKKVFRSAAKKTIGQPKLWRFRDTPSKRWWKTTDMVYSGQWSAELDYSQLLKDNPRVFSNFSKFYSEDFKRFGYDIMPMDRVRREYLKPCLSAGIVIGTYGTPNYIQLQLESIRRLQGNVPVLLVDDSSPQQEELKQLCDRYGVEFLSSPKRYNHWKGDMNVFIEGIKWAKSNNIDLLLKLSRRRVFMRPIVQDLLKLANQTRRTGVAFGYGEEHGTWDATQHTWMNTSAIAMKIHPWSELALPEIEDRFKSTGDRELVLMEQYMLSVAGWLHDQIFDKMVAYPLAWFPGLKKISLFKEHNVRKDYVDFGNQLGLRFEISDFDDDVEMFQQYRQTKDMWSQGVY